jgi:hypothetical protein
MSSPHMTYITARSRLTTNAPNRWLVLRMIQILSFFRKQIDLFRLFYLKLILSTKWLKPYLVSTPGIRIFWINHSTYVNLLHLFYSQLIDGNVFNRSNFLVFMSTLENKVI